MFDAATLFIDQVSLGFLKMLRLPADKDLRGQGLEEVLHINPLSSVESRYLEHWMNAYKIKPIKLNTVKETILKLFGN